MAHADEDSKALGMSLADAPMQLAKGDRFSQSLAKFERTMRIGYTRYILGDKAGDQLGLPDTAAKYFWPAQAPIRFGTELVRMSVPALNRFIVKRGEKVSREQFPLQVQQTQADTSFTPVAKLAR